VFWSGGDIAKNAAADYAEASGGQTLEQTLTGRLLGKLPYNKITAKLWDAASGRFAQGAEGPVHVFFGPGAPFPGSTFTRIEAPILNANGNEIIQHFVGG
jgi:hypothetical protein